MRKSFIAYVFRPHRVILAVISFLGIIGNVNNKICWIILISSALNFVFRGFSYFVDVSIEEKRQKTENENKGREDGFA